MLEIRCRKWDHDTAKGLLDAYSEILPEVKNAAPGAAGQPPAMWGLRPDIRAKLDVVPKKKK